MYVFLVHATHSFSLCEGDRLIYEGWRWNSRTYDWHKTPKRAPKLHQTSQRAGTHICRATKSGEGLFIRQWRGCEMCLSVEGDGGGGREGASQDQGAKKKLRRYEIKCHIFLECNTIHDHFKYPIQHLL